MYIDSAYQLESKEHIFASGDLFKVHPNCPVAPSRDDQFLSQLPDMGDESVLFSDRQCSHLGYDRINGNPGLHLDPGNCRASGVRDFDAKNRLSPYFLG